MSVANSKFSTLRTIATRVFSVVGLITCALLAAALIVVMFRCASGEEVPDKTVLELDLRGSLVENASGDTLSQLLGGDGMTLRQAVDALDRAADDKRVGAVVAHVGRGYGLAQTQELRDAVLRFRKSGKKTFAFAESFGEFGTGNSAFYLASAFDSVWLQPSGELGMTGLMSSAMFVKGSFELFDVEFEGGKRREYKNAFNMYTERRFTEPHAEALRTILEDFETQMVQGIAAQRDLSEDEVRALIPKGPFLANEALAYKLVDKLGYRDEVVAAAKTAAGGDSAQLLFAHKYMQIVGPRHSGDQKIALIYGVGGVSSGSSSADPLSGSRTMGSDTVTAAFRAAVADPNVKAIVFRVDSPGGSAVASDTIWRETVLAREAGKPVIVSMGNVAGSGGYYVAAGATKIVAQPATITGSIGVFAGKPNLRKLWNKLGVTYDSVSTAPNAEMFSDVHSYDEHGWERLNAMLDQVYLDFKQRVADGRGMTMEQVEELARGRIWSGVRAKELGLVDELGGVETAVRLAKEASGVDADSDVQLVVFPPAKSLLSQLLSGESRRSSEDSGAAARASVATGLERWRPVIRHLEQAGLGPDQPGALTMMPMQLNE